MLWDERNPQIRPTESLQLGFFCIQGHAVFHADHTCFELHREDAACASCLHTLVMETDETGVDLICFSIPFQGEPRLIYAPGDIVKNTPHLVSHSILHERGYLCWEKEPAVSSHGLCMGFFRGEGPALCFGPPRIFLEEQEAIFFVYETRDTFISLKKDDEGTEASGSEDLLREQDALILPHGSDPPQARANGLFAAAWAAFKPALCSPIPPYKVEAPRAQ